MVNIKLMGRSGFECDDGFLNVDHEKYLFALQMEIIRTINIRNQVFVALYT